MIWLQCIIGVHSKIGCADLIDKEINLIYTDKRKLFLGANDIAI